MGGGGIWDEGKYPLSPNTPKLHLSVEYELNTQVFFFRFHLRSDIRIQIPLGICPHWIWIQIPLHPSKDMFIFQS